MAICQNDDPPPLSPSGDDDYSRSTHVSQSYAKPESLTKLRMRDRILHVCPYCTVVFFCDGKLREHTLVHIAKGHQLKDEADLIKIIGTAGQSEAGSIFHGSVNFIPEIKFQAGASIPEPSSIPEPITGFTWKCGECSHICDSSLKFFAHAMLHFNQNYSTECEDTLECLNIFTRFNQATDQFLIHYGGDHSDGESASSDSNKSTMEE